MRRIDLHVHTTASDGTFSPAETVSLAHSLGLSAIAITDHDTVSGYSEAAAEGRKLDIEVIPGIELSTNYKGAVHILGYFIDPAHPELCRELQQIIDERDSRNRRIAARMQDDGINVSYDAMKERFGGSIGRPHFAEILMEHHLASSTADAFRRFLNKGGQYWIPRTLPSLEQCITLIRAAGGIPVLAHPFEYTYQQKSLPELIEVCMGFGLQGIECRHSIHDTGQMVYLEHLADEYGLLKTGGSDFHGEVKPDIRLGCGKGLLSVPEIWLDELKRAKQQS